MSRDFEVPETHPRYQSLMMRERISQGVRDGLVDITGLIAHGRGEAFDYMIGERTIEPAVIAIEAAAAALKLAGNRVISDNGNTAVLCAGELVEMATAADAKLEVNLFHWSQERVERIIDHMRAHGAENALGVDADQWIPGLEQPRGRCCEEGIFTADVVFVPLEDGDRAQALKAMGKTVITVDLNPLSRTARTCDITIVDNIVRAVPLLTQKLGEIENVDELPASLESYDNRSNLDLVKETLVRSLGITS